MVYDRERPSFEESNNVTVKRCFYAYEYAEQFVKGKIAADIGCGTGYGTVHLAQFADKITGVDYSEATLNQSRIDYAEVKNMDFVVGKVPPVPLGSESVDVVTSFQFIEHIHERPQFIQDVFRVLKPGGVFICTTPNAKMSLARNPFHVHEYTFDEILKEFKKTFKNVELMGLQGNETVNAYYRENAKWVRKILKWDIFSIHKILPSSWVAWPYNFLTTLMRRDLMEKVDATTHIKTSDFFIQKDNLDKTWDIFVVARKD